MKVEYLNKGWYKEFLIPKKKNKFRKICSPSLSLLEYQQKELKKIEKIFNSVISKTIVKDVPHGFIKKRNCVTAATKHIGFDTTIIIDIENFFDSVFKDIFLNNEKTKKISTDENLFHKNGYCAQGFATSPMLANIAIIESLIEIKEYLNKVTKKHAFTIYADDIHISINNEHSENKYIIEKQIIFKVSAILGRHGFKVNSNKTRILRAKFGYRKILGINVGKDSVRATRRTMKKIRAAKHQKNSQSIGGLVTWSKCILPKQN